MEKESGSPKNPLQTRSRGGGERNQQLPGDARGSRSPARGVRSEEGSARSWDTQPGRAGGSLVTAPPAAGAVRPVGAHPRVAGSHGGGKGAPLRPHSPGTSLCTPHLSPGGTPVLESIYQTLFPPPPAKPPEWLLCLRYFCRGFFFCCFLGTTVFRLVFFPPSFLRSYQQANPR